MSSVLSTETVRLEEQYAAVEQKILKKSRFDDDQDLLGDVEAWTTKPP